MKLFKSMVYAGPNIHAPDPLIRLIVKPGALGAKPARDFADVLARQLPDIAPHLTSQQSENGEVFWDRALHAPDCTLIDVLAQLALALQKKVGSGPEKDYCRASPSCESGCVDVLYNYGERETGLAAGQLARRILLELVDPKDSHPFSIEEELEDFADEAASRRLGPSARALVAAAEARGIPWMRLNGASLIQLGHGKYQKRIEAALTSDTSHIAVEIAKDKMLCAHLLRDIGVPTTEQEYVRSERGALRAAARLGYPVVVKPLDGNHGRGVSINLQTEDQVCEAYQLAREESRSVLVERFVEGDDYRLLVIGGKLSAAARRTPARVVGDGVSTIRDLVDRENRDPRRGNGHDNLLTRLQIDARARAMLAARGLAPESVPAEGEVVFLKMTANLSTGGTAIDVTDIIHPDNALMAVRAVKAVGLDIGGVDFITTDITKSYRETGGAVCEINAGPGIRMHVDASEGGGRDIGGAVIDMLYPPGARSRIPIAAITGTNGKTTTARMLAHIMRLAGHVVGQTSTDAVMIDGAATVTGDMTGPVAANMVLRDPSVDLAVLEVARGGILRAGLGFSECDVGAVLNVTSDHLGLGGVHTLEDLARVKRLVVEAARDTAVLNADNEQALRMAGYTPARHICFVTKSASNAVVREHIQSGGRALVLEETTRGEQINFYDKGKLWPLLWTHLIPATIEGKARHNVENAMFAAAMAHALGASFDQICAGLRSFEASFKHSPGRMNIHDGHGFRVVLDYGHNEAAIASMVAFTQSLDVGGRRLVALTSPGDRRDEDICAVARAAANRFDRYFCHTDDDLRGRAPGEVAHLIAAELMARGVPPDLIEIAPSEANSLGAALSTAGEGDLLLLFCADFTSAWERITYFRPAMRANGSASEAPVAAPARVPHDGEARSASFA